MREAKVKVKVKNLTKKFGGLLVLDDISFEVKEGEFLCIVGPTGCGKTTFLNSLTKLYDITAGEILVNGEPVDLKRHNIANIFQEYSTFPWLKVEENVKYGLRIKGIAEDEVQRRADEVIAMVGLEEFRGYYPDQLSASMLQRVVIARAFAVQPELLIMDEPTAGLDVEARNEILDMLRAYIAEDESRSILITSHISTDLESLCDELYLIHDGKLILHEATDAILEQYGILKVSEEQYRTLDQSSILKVQKENYGYACFTDDKKFYQENYPQIAVENGGIDELILMMTGGYR